MIVTLHGDLDGTVSAGLASVLSDLIDGQGNLAVAVDLREVHRIDRSGVEVLTRAAAEIATRGGELRLDGLRGAVRDVLDPTGRARLVSIPIEETPRPGSSGEGETARSAAMRAHPAASRRDV